MYKNFPQNRSMPVGAIIPVLGYDNVGEAIEWLCETFGFTERWRIGDHRAQLAIGDSAIAVTERQGRNEDSADDNFSMMVRVTDVRRHYEHALQQGATILEPPTDFPYGERQYAVVDLGGYVWKFSESIADIPPEEWGAV